MLLAGTPLGSPRQTQNGCLEAAATGPNPRPPQRGHKTDRRWETMEVDLQKFRRDGYLVLRNVVPPEQLDEIRLLTELMVDREKARSAAQRQAGAPPGGASSICFG